MADHLAPTPATIDSISFSVTVDQQDNDIIFPSYDANLRLLQTPEAPSEIFAGSSASPQGLQCSNPRTAAADDSSIEEKPSSQIDYLSHEWKEEDLWTSWRYVFARRGTYNTSARLENASWRNWARLKLNLSTVSPESLNWLKDCDTTWLYGPLKKCNKREQVLSVANPRSRLGTQTIQVARKPILKRRPTPEFILQCSLSQCTLLQHHVPIARAKEVVSSHNFPSSQQPVSKLGQMPSQLSHDFSLAFLDHNPTNTSSSILGSPSNRRHIEFNNEVVQWMAVEAGGDEDGECIFEDGSSSESDNVVAMTKHFSRWMPASEGGANLPNGLYIENSMIAPLPPTTLKNRGDAPDPPRCSIENGVFGYLSTSTPFSISPETLRSSGSAKFFLDDEDNDFDFS